MEDATDSPDHDQDQVAGKPTKTFATVATVIALVGLLASTIGTGIQASHASAGIRPENSYGSLIRTVGMLLVLGAGVGYVGRSVMARHRKKWIHFREQQIAFRNAILTGIGATGTHEFEGGRPFRVQFLIVAARVCGALFVVFAVIVFASMIAMYVSRLSRGRTLIDYWFEVFVSGLMTPMAIASLGLIFFCLAEILDHVVLAALPKQNRVASIDKDAPAAPTVE